MKKIAILGSTGSIGTQTLDVVRANGDIEVLGISAGRNVKMLEEQAREFHPQLIAVWDENAAKDLAVRLADMDVKIVSGMEGLLELARMPQTDILVTAVVGMIGIRPTMEGIKAGKDIALANKETLVTAGHLIIPMAKEHGVQILPVDSEHSAIFQALHGEKQAQVEKLLITASGGPFRGRKREELEHVTLADTLKHPNWVMGQKITVDSATLVNKGLEVMEARWLFDVDLDHIQVVVQPKSIIHSMVEFKDGAVMAQLGTPDMRLPIQYALYYPERRYLDGERLDFHNINTDQPFSLGNLPCLPYVLSYCLQIASRLVFLKASLIISNLSCGNNSHSSFCCHRASQGATAHSHAHSPLNNRKFCHLISNFQTSQTAFVFSIQNNILHALI